MTRPKRRSTRERADRLLAGSGLVANPERAAPLIMAGRVLWSDERGRERKVRSAGEPLPLNARFRLKGELDPYVARSARKLEAALDAMGLDVTDAVAIDAGIGTGGFTECLLERGARRVHGVDVGYGMVAMRLREDRRVVLHERANIRHLTTDDLGERADLLVADLSFIGLQSLLPTFVGLLAESALLVLLVKPQFELERSEVPAGVVTDDAARAAAVDRVCGAGRALGLGVLGRVESPVPGSKGGNREILVGLTRGDVGRFKRKLDSP